MSVRCAVCRWPYVSDRYAEHIALHGLLPEWPHPLDLNLPMDLRPTQYSLEFAAIVINQLRCLDPDKEVRLVSYFFLLMLCFMISLEDAFLVFSHPVSSSCIRIRGYCSHVVSLSVALILVFPSASCRVCFRFTRRYFPPQPFRLMDVAYQVFVGRWPGVEEPPWGLDVAVRIIKARLPRLEFVEFYNIIRLWDVMLRQTPF